MERGHDTRRAGPRQSVGALQNRHRTLRILAQGNAGYTEHSRLFLHAARIGQDHPSVVHQLQEMKVAERIEDPEPVHGGDGARRCWIGQRPAQPRVGGNDHGNLLLNPADSDEDFPERGRLVDVRRPVQRQDGVRSGRQTEP